MFSYSHSHSIKDHPGQMAGVIGISALMGAVGAMLFTPRRGSEMRRMVQDRGKHMKDKTRQMRKSDKDISQSTVDQTGSAINRLPDADDGTGSTPSGTEKSAPETRKGGRSKNGPRDVADEIRRQGEP